MHLLADQTASLIRFGILDKVVRTVLIYAALVLILRFVGRRATRDARRRKGCMQGTESKHLRRQRAPQRFARHRRRDPRRRRRRARP